MVNQDVIDRAMEWLVCGDTGLSSTNILTNILSSGKTGKIKNFYAKSHPFDPSDLKRCVILLDKIPELRDSLHIMRSVSKQWDVLIENWDELERSLKSEMESSPRSARKTNQLMKRILDQVVEDK